MSYTKDDERYMRRCLQLARNGQQNAKPNPMVGAVIVAPKTSNLKPQTSNLKPQTSNLKPQTVLSARVTMCAAAKVTLR